MGIAFVLLGLLGSVLVADFVIENWTDASERSFSVFGGSFVLSDTQVVLAAAAIGAVSLLLVLMGFSLLRGSRGRRRATRDRISELERENAELRARQRAIAIHEDEPREVAEVERLTVRRDEVGADRSG